MPIKKRSGNSLSLRGGGGSGSGSVAIYNTDTDEANVVATKATKIVIADGNDFVAYADSNEETTIYLGAAPDYLDPIAWSSSQTTNVRISESDVGEADTYLTNGKEGTTMKGALGDFSFSSTVGRGFGPESLLTVKTYHAGTLVDDTSFVCDSNGSQNSGNVSVSISNIAPDGAGDVYQGKLSVTINTFGLIGSNNSGVCRVEISFKEQKWGDTVSTSQDIFKDNNTETPSITGGSTVRDHDDATLNKIKYLSGIGYFVLDNPFMFESLTINNLNEDSSHPTANLTVDAEELGITTYTSSPWSDASDWSNVTNLDTVQGIDYTATKTVNKNNFRHIGSSIVENTIRDSWNDAGADSSNTLKVCIDTVSNPSTDLVEYFDEENMRLSHADISSSWDSTAYLSDGEGVFFGGGFYHGADLPRILENVEGALGTCGSLSSFIPDKDVTGSSRQNPNYTGHNRPAVFWRKFFTPTTTSHTAFTMNIQTNGDLSSHLSSGDLKIYIWKLDSTDNTTPNIVLPTSYSVVSPADSLAGSIWAHEPYNFANYDDGLAQTASTSGCRVSQSGNLLNLSVGSYSILDGILVRFECEKGVVLKEVSVNFT